MEHARDAATPAGDDGPLAVAPEPHGANGGLPLPTGPAAIAGYHAHHLGCGETTRVVLPAAVPATAIARLRCAGCGERFEARLVAELDPATASPASALFEDPATGAEAPSEIRALAGRLPGWSWVPLAIAAAAGALLLIQGPGSPSATEPAAPASPGAATQAAGVEAARTVRREDFTLALPRGWRTLEGRAGAAFEAQARGGGAQAQLWVERQASPDLDELERIARLRLIELSGVEPSISRQERAGAGEVVTLSATGPSRAPDHEVVLAASGERSYYLATTVEHDAGARAREGARLIRDSLVPEAGGEQGR